MTTLLLDDLGELTIAYGDTLNATGDAVGAELSDLFARLGATRRENIPEFVDLARPSVRAGQMEALDLTTAYLRETSGAWPTTFPVEYVHPLAWDVPFLRTWHEIGQGMDWNQAKQSGASQAEALGHDAVRSAAHQRMDHSGLRTVGFRRVPSARACEWCATVAGQTYKSAASASLQGQHKKCQCSVIPIYSKGNDPGRTAARQRLAALKGRRA